jgi:amicyanin
MSKQSLSAALVLAAALALSAFAPAPVAKADDATVTIDNFTFDPPKLTVKAGTTVTWLNRDDIPHTIASATKLFKSRAMDTDEKFSFTFTSPGAYEYFCSLHPHMKATIVVEAGAGK